MIAEITLDGPDETHTVSIDARDRRAFERAAGSIPGLPPGQPLLEAIKAIPETYTAWLAWSAAARRGAFAGTFEEFEDRLVEVAAQAEDGDGEGLLPGPTRPAP